MANKTIEEMAEDVGVKPENLKKGLDSDKRKQVEEAVKAAYAFKHKKRSKK